MRESFVFYRSFYDAISHLPPDIQNEVYNAIFRYSFYGEDPEIDGTAKAIFTLIKPNIDAATQRYAASVENGKKGGAPKGNQNAKKQPKNNLKQPNNNLTETQEKPNNNLNDNVNDNDNVNVNKDDNCSSAENSVIQTFESELGRLLSPMEMDTIHGWQLDHSDDIIREALNRAVKNDVKNLAYIGGILNDWLSNHVKTLDDVRKRDKERTQKKGSMKNERGTKPVNPYEGLNFGTVL